MLKARRLTDQERSTIVRERAKGVAASDLAARFTVSPKTIYNVLSHGRSVRSANASRSRVLTMRVSEDDLRRFDAALSRRGTAHRSDAMRRLILAAEGVVLPDDEMYDELRSLGAALNRVGNNVNQMARRLNEAKVRGERLSYPASSHRDIRALAGLVCDLADRVQEMSRARRSVLDLEINSTLAGLAERDSDGEP